MGNTTVPHTHAAHRANNRFLSHVHETTIAQDWRKLLIVFFVMSFVGLAGETLQHLVATGEWEHRAGFIWGPFSPIYGLAAVLLTIFLEPIAIRGSLIVFLVAALVGGGVEYLASWAMETFWGVVAWSYLDIPGNFNGRTDIFHMILWGALGLLWVRFGLTFTQDMFDHFKLKSARQILIYRIACILLALFLVLDIFVTITVMLRCDARAHGVAPVNELEVLYDEIYPNEVLQDRFNNMGGIGIP